MASLSIDHRGSKFKGKNCKELMLFYFQKMCWPITFHLLSYTFFLNQKGLKLCAAKELKAYQEQSVEDASKAMSSTQVVFSVPRIH